MRYLPLPARASLMPLLVVCLVVTACEVDPASHPDLSAAFDPERLMSDVQTYYDFGIHRTAHDGDLRTSDWLAERFRALGLETSEHSLSLRQFMLDEASIEDAQGRIEAFPIWLPRATEPQVWQATDTKLSRLTLDQYVLSPECASPEFPFPRIARTGDLTNDTFRT